MKTGVVPVLGLRDLGSSFVRVGIEKTSKTCFNTLVQALCLAVDLRVVHRTHAQLNSYQFKKFSPKDTGEDAIAIGYDRKRNAMKLVHCIYKNLGT